MTPLQPNTPAYEAAVRLIEAARAYREALKQHLPAELKGVIWLEVEEELVLYTGSPRYREQLRSLTHDGGQDRLTFTLAPGGA